MVYQEIGNFNQSEGAISLFKYTADIVPAFIPLLLFSFFLITLLGSFFYSKRSIGRGDFYGSFAVASWLTLIISLIFTLIPNMITNTIIVPIIGLTILSTALLIINRIEDV